MSLHHKIVRTLPAAELRELEAFADDRMRTIDECHAWLARRGHKIGRTAVGNWLRHRRPATASISWLSSQLEARFDAGWNKIKRKFGRRCNEAVAALRDEFFRAG